MTLGSAEAFTQGVVLPGGAGIQGLMRLLGRVGVLAWALPPSGRAILGSKTDDYKCVIAGGGGGRLDVAQQPQPCPVDRPRGSWAGAGAAPTHGALPEGCAPYPHGCDEAKTWLEHRPRLPWDGSQEWQGWEPSPVSVAVALPFSVP